MTPTETEHGPRWPGAGPLYSEGSGSSRCWGSIAAEKGVETKTQVRIQSQVCTRGLNGSVEEKLTDGK